MSKFTKTLSDVPSLMETTAWPKMITIDIDHTLWTSVNQSIQLHNINPEAELDDSVRILSATLEKSQSFNTGTVMFGNGSLSSERETFATGSEVNCQTTGTIELNTWRNSSVSGITGGWNNLIKNSSQRITARFEGPSLPTQGSMTLHLMVYTPHEGIDPPDIEIPDPPFNLSILPDGSQLSGQGEPLTEVIVTNFFETVVGSGNVDANGQFTVALNPPQNQGGVLTVVLKNADGNSSQPVQINAPGEPAELDWYDGGYPSGFVSEFTFPDEQSVSTFVATPETFSDDAVYNAPSVCRFILEPGTYRAAGPEHHDYYIDGKDFVHIVGREAAWDNGVVNPNATRISGFTSWLNNRILIENIVFFDTSLMYDEPNNGPDYACYFHRESEVQIKNCVFNGQYIHDISLKRAQDLAEIVGNRFIESERHSVEIGQEVNYASDLTQVQKTVIYGNSFLNNKLHAITNSNSKLVIVQANTFQNIAARPIQTLTINSSNPGSDLRMLEEPMRVEILDNVFVGSFMPMWFRGRGRVDDTILVQRNSGIDINDFILDPMHPDDAALFAAAGDPVDTLDAPSLDPNSDILGPPQQDWYDGGFPTGFTSEITIPAEQDITTSFVTPATFTDSLIDNAPASCRFVLEPGTYRNTGEYTDFFVGEKDFVHIVGKEAAWVSGAPNPNAARVTGFTSWINQKIILENIVFFDTSYLYDEVNNGPDYACYFHRESEVQVKNCVYNGQYIHDVSLKRAQDLAEIVGNRFINSERHCVEVGQEINHASDLTQVQKTVIYGNHFTDAKNATITNQSSKLVIVENNTFHNSGRAFRSLPLNSSVFGNDIRLLEEPLRVEIRNNIFTGTMLPLWFEGRGRVNDTVLILGNTGLTESDVLFTEMYPDDVTAFANAGDPVDTDAPPTLDLASDIIPVDPESPPSILGSWYGATDVLVTDHEIVLPGGVQAGERLFAFLSIGSSDLAEIPTGWTIVYDTTNQMTGMCITKIADGNEGTSITVTTPNARASTYVTIRVDNSTQYDYNYYNTGDNPTNAESPDLSPSMGTFEYLWLTVVHWRQGTRTVTPPTGFNVVRTADTGFAGAGENHTTLAYRFEETGTMAPSDWISNQIDTELNNHITGILGIVGGSKSGGGTVQPGPDPDLDIPNPPTNLAITNDGITLTGNGEAGMTVIVRNASNTTVGQDTVAGNGTFTVTLNPPQTDGGVLSVTIVNADNRSSNPANINAPDIDVDPVSPPSILGSWYGSSEISATDHTVVLPANVAVGERLFVFMSIGGSDEATIPAGWTVVYDTTNQMTGLCITKIADGTEGSSITITQAVARVMSYVVVRVANSAGYDVNWFNTGDNPTNAETADLTATRGTQEYLWLTAVHWRQGTRTTTAPTDYTVIRTADTGFAGAAENHTSLAYRFYEGTTQEPGDWLSNQIDTEINNHITCLIAIAGGTDPNGGIVVPGDDPVPDPDPDPDPDPSTAPVIESSTGLAAEDFQTVHTINLPTNAVVGDRLFVYFTVAASDEFVSSPAGWDVVYETTNQFTGTCITRVVDGTEGPTISFETPTARISTYVAVRVSGANAYEPDWISSGDHPTEAEVPVFPAANGTMNYLWMAAVHWRQGSRTVTPPPGFTMVQTIDSGYDGVIDNHTSVSFLVSETAELSPASWGTNEVSPDLNNYISSLIALNS